MTLPLYLAMTAPEVSSCAHLPGQVAWMGCHFSSAHKGLSNLPKDLKEGSLLMVDDWNPIDGHDPQIIADQLQSCVKTRNLKGVILDFQRQGVQETTDLCKYLTKHLPCPTAVTEWYAEGLSCPVFLSTPPLRQALEAYLAPWQKREIWLEAALEAEEVTITETASSAVSTLPGVLPEPWHKAESFHCRYHWALAGRNVCFHLQRTKEDLTALLEEAAALGVSLAVGLYQQLK